MHSLQHESAENIQEEEIFRNVFGVNFGITSTFQTRKKVAIRLHVDHYLYEGIPEPESREKDTKVVFSC